MRLQWDSESGKVYTVWACPFNKLTENPQPWVQVADYVEGEAMFTTWEGAEPNTAYRVGVYITPLIQELA